MANPAIRPFQSPNCIPVIDIAPFVEGGPAERGIVADLVASACEANGFFMIAGHAFDQRLLADCFATARDFFELPLDEKRRVAPPSRDVFRGYFAREVRRTAAYREKVEHGDLKEEYLIGTPDPRPAIALAELPGMGPAIEWREQPNIWPQHPAQFATTFLRFYAAMEALSATMYRIFATALHLPADYFADKTDRHGSKANWGYYPAQDVPPKPGQIRQGAHTDIGTFTILAADSSPGGLQVQTASGAWIDVRPQPGVFAINLGDMMARWTNDRWRATMHRVVNPPETLRQSVRQSMGYFGNPNLDAVIECLPTCLERGESAKYPPVLAGDHMRYRMLASRMAMAAAE
jgi:isopenicillin N synthase-like dioxygenase